VETLDAQSVTVNLVNANPLRPRRLIIQAGAFGEHSFTEATDLLAPEDQRHPLVVNGKHLAVHLAPGGAVRLVLGMKRYCNKPSYEQPAL